MEKSTAKQTGTDKRLNRDEDLSHRGEGKPPAAATDPGGESANPGASKTATNPSTGEPNR
ncbi:MAG: hypothetical protein JO303_16345 [Caulobacteraceae bacterium]|nr:hypothetical protein [Caulobacteraceae bacterium]